MTQPNHLDELGNTQLASECYILKNGKALMFKRSETASKFPGWWIGPGGHIDEGEDALTAAIREVEEEAGIKVSTDDIKLKAIAFHHHLDRNEIWISFIFLATIPEEQKEKESDLEGKAAWIPLEDLFTMENVFPPSKYYFNHVLGDNPGILYANIEWKNAQLVRVISQRIDKNG